MKLTLRRIHYDPDYTVGELFIDGVKHCFTLEDTFREVNAPVTTWKIPGKTAIPTGTYKVEVTFSARFTKPLPILVDVPGFEGIRIHPGNTSSDTEGCILVGQDWDGGDCISKSRIAFTPLFDRIQQSNDVMIEIL